MQLGSENRALAEHSTQATSCWRCGTALSCIHLHLDHAGEETANLEIHCPDYCWHERFA